MVASHSAAISFYRRIIRAAMPQLKDFENQTVILLLLDPTQPGGLEKRIVKLLTVDNAGIWIEDQKLTNDVLENLKLEAAPTQVTPFFPYSAIHAIFALVPGLSLSEKAFGA
jgi:hypothetical protein